MRWYLDVLRKYADFSDRSRRMEYWMFLLMNFVVSLALGLVGPMLGMRWLSYVYAVFVLIPGIAVSVRRLHDTGRSGWWLLVALIPVLGWLWALYLMLLDSDPGDNAFGPNPKLATA